MPEPKKCGSGTSSMKGVPCTTWAGASICVVLCIEVVMRCGGAPLCLPRLSDAGGAVDRRTEDESEGSGALGVQVIARAASVLRALENRPEGLSLGQIAKEVGLARSTVQRIVAALQAEHFLA